MKVRTNLTADELELVAKGLKKLSEKQQHDGQFVPANPAEQELMSEVTDALDMSLESLTSEISKLFIEE